MVVGIPIFEFFPQMGLDYGANDEESGGHTNDAYLADAAKALSAEYKAIVDAGFNLQLDAPDLAMRAHPIADSAPSSAGRAAIPMRPG